LSAPERGRFAEYFRLQLLLAETVAARTGEPLALAVTQLTNLQRRLRLEEASAWAAFTEQLSGLPTTDARMELILDAFIAAPTDPFGKSPFGCFAHEPPDAEGMVRIHFPGGDAADGAGPLARHKVGRRQAELAAMTRSIRERFPEAEAIRGGSWLYNLEAYRRLFPPAFGDSRTSPGVWRLGGTSTWASWSTTPARCVPRRATSSCPGCRQSIPRRLGRCSRSGPSSPMRRSRRSPSSIVTSR
jgi:hypothetical protein